MKKYIDIVKHYENCFEIHGDTHRGVDWPDRKGMNLRYEIMLQLLKYNNENKKIVHNILDLGCGTAGLYKWLTKKEIQNVNYEGLDISNKFIEYCRKKYPDQKFYCQDILIEKVKKKYDYIIMNGVFTEKRDLTQKEMLNYFINMLLEVNKFSVKGFAFNLMSKEVDWERDDLFHLSYDKLAKIIIENFGRKFIIRNDYKMYEYTVYVYK